MTPKHADSTHYLAGPLEGFKIERHGVRVTVTRPDGSISRCDECLTEEMARIAVWQIREEAYNAADAGGHL